MHTNALVSRAVFLPALALIFLVSACSGPQKPKDEPIGTPPVEEEKRLPRDPSKDDTSQLQPSPTTPRIDRTSPG